MTLDAAFFRERWITIASFLAALFFHVALVTVGTRQYLGAPLSPEGANQAVKKLEDAIKKRNMRFVYVNDDPRKPGADKPNPDPRAPLSDKDRIGSSPDGGKGSSPDPFSRGNSPQRRAFSPPTAKSPPGSRAAAPGGGVAGAEAGRRGSRSGEGGRANSPSERILEEAQKRVPGTSGKEVPDSGKGLPVKGETETLPEGPQGRRGQAGGKVGLTNQLGKMMLESLGGGYNNPNASRLNQGSVSFDTAGWDLGPYARIVQEKVESNWRIPAVQEYLRQKGWVSIKFEILKDGRVGEIAVIKPSGVPSYDQSAMDALRSSNPFPPLPENVTADKITGTFRFFYFMWNEEEDTQ